MEWIQPLFVFLAAGSAVGYLIFKWMPKSKKNKDSSCGTDCGCH
ncbi:FeoB-associated Cys-rich membrane protein [Flavobacteriaceae bacterium]|nr:FeoB-associated Cys-rich membrane protein [Flavobacteriaceae bacterium]MDA9016037.1 FeoB-associated Cys-rich membrane protein [Flavobacteriaceae bacterium]